MPCWAAGKRVRPLLAFAAGEITGADAARVAIAGAAVELIHAYSLVHDDLPCMDDDVLRRGKPTCHVEFDEATALWSATRCRASRSNWCPNIASPTTRRSSSKW